MADSSLGTLMISALDREERTATIAEMIGKTNSLEMRWLIMIILKGELDEAGILTGGYVLRGMYAHLGFLCTDLKLGVSEKTIFAEFHPDAEDLFNVTCDLKLVCDKLKDRTKRVKRQVGELLIKIVLCAETF